MRKNVLLSISTCSLNQLLLLLVCNMTNRTRRGQAKASVCGKTVVVHWMISVISILYDIIARSDAETICSPITLPQAVYVVRPHLSLRPLPLFNTK